MKRNRDIFAGIELGSDKIRVVVASFQESQDQKVDLVVRGFAETDSQKMRKDEPIVPGVVADKLEEALAKAMADVNEVPGYFARVLSGNYIHTQNISATVKLDPMMTIDDADIEHALNAVNKKGTELVNDPNSTDDYTSMPCLGRVFRLADNRPFFNPAGQSSTTLTAESICVAANKARLNAIDALMMPVLQGYPIDFSTFAPVAAACAVLPPSVADEPQGLVIDLGAGMTSYAIPTKIGFAVCEQLGVGVEHLANDICYAFGLPINTARSIIQKMGGLGLTLQTTRDGSLRGFSVVEQDSSVPQRYLISSEVEEVLEVRMRETFQLIKQRLEELDVLKWAGNEILLTGVGASLPRVTDLASSVFKRHARVALPYGITGRGDFPLGPQYAMVLGLLRAARQEANLQTYREASEGGFLGRIKNWFTVASNY